MAEATHLSDIYVEELQDLWSANDQMKRVVEEMAKTADSRQLQGRLDRAASGIQLHTDLLKGLIEEAGGTLRKEHCRGMEGLVREARKHALEEEMEGSLRDLAIIAQYQRMTHYGLAGFGTAKAYAEALGRSDQAEKLDRALKQIYRSDEFMSDLAQQAKALRAAA